MELVYDELEPQAAAELRRAVQDCPPCRDALARLEEAKCLADALPLEPLPSTARETILAAARETAASRRAPEPLPLRLRLARSRAWPPLAMAAVALLAVVVGVSYSPKEEADELARLVPVPRRPRGEASAPPEAPAPRRTEESPPEVRLPERPSAERKPPDETSPVAPAASAQGRRPREEPRLSRRTRASTRSRHPAPPGEPPETATATGGPLGGSPSATRQELADETPASTLRRQTARASGGLGMASPAAVTRPAPPGARRPHLLPTEPPVRVEGTEAPAPTAAEAVEAPQAPASLPVAEALLRLARNYRARGECALAARHYADLRRRFPSAPAIPQALVEEADCRRRLGQLTQAQVLLRQATGYRSTEAVARRELRRVDTLLSAPQRVRRVPAAAAAEAAH